MRIKVHQRHLAKVFCMGAQQWQCDVVVAAKGHHALAIGQQFFSMGLQFVGEILRITEGVNQIAAIDDVQTLTQVEIPRPAAAFPGQIGGDLANRARTQAAARRPEVAASNGTPVITHSASLS